MATFDVELTGGAPWGFSMVGGSDFNQPLNISKVTPGSKAALKGIRIGLTILGVNGQDMQNVRHMDAVQFVKQCSRSGSISLTLEQGLLRTGEDLNVILGEFSTIPTMYRDTDKSDNFVEHRPIDHNESKRRIFDDSKATQGNANEWKPNAYQSTQQSPSFIKAVKPPSANPSGPNLSEPIKLDINPELQSMINSNQSTGPVYQPPKVAPPQKPAVKTFSPEPPQAKSFSPVYQSPVTSPSPVSPAPRGQQPQPVAQQPAGQPNADYHDLRNPQKSGVMRLPTVNFNQKPLGPTKPVDKKANALSNISGFMNKTSGGAVARGTLGSPEFLQPLVDREFPIGEPAVLEVRIAGTAPLTVQWYHNSQPVRESIEKDIRLLQKGNVFTMVYGEFSHALLGRYTCQASNQKGTVTSSCVVTEGGYSDDDIEQYPTAKFSHGPQPPSNPAYARTVQSSQSGLPSKTRVVTKKPLNQLVTSGNASLYSNNAIEEGLHSALGIQPDQSQPVNDESAVLAAIEGRGDSKKQTSRTLAKLAQQLDDDL